MTEAPIDELPSASESTIQPFFLLHKASVKKDVKKVAVEGPKKTRRKIELSPVKLRRCEASEVGSGDGENENTSKVDSLRMEAFMSAWSMIESTIQDVLRKFNVTVYDDIYQWVCESFEAIQLRQIVGQTQLNRSYPIVTDAGSKQIFIGFVLTKNMDFVDDLLTFHDLGVYLKSKGCHVANLSSMDFSPKAGIGGCLRSMLRQFLTVCTDAADISVLASWYREQGEPYKSMVIIIDDMERCCGSVLAEFILLLSEWVLKLPIILLIGVSTTVDTARTTLPLNVLHYFSPSKFLLGSPAEKMDAIVEAVLINQQYGFSIGYNVAGFMRSYFLRQDGTLTSFIRALKIACVHHFSRLTQNDNNINSLLEEETHERCKNYWTSVLMCLHETGKSENIRLLDLFCEALGPEMSMHVAPNKKLYDFGEKMSGDQCIYQHSFKRSGFISQAMNSLRDLNLTQLSQLIQKWDSHTADIEEINKKVKAIRNSIVPVDGNTSKQEANDFSKRITSMRRLNLGKDTTNEKALALIKSLVRDYMPSPKKLEEASCFNNAESLQSAMIGDPRRQIQVDLLDVQKILKCSCCNRKGSIILPTMHDTCILYTLAQEHGDLLNLHDWYQSFKTIINPVSQDTNKMKKKASTPKKRKAVEEEPTSITEATIQARFCRGVIELQITGLLRMPSKRRPDYVQRVAFGL